VKNTKETHNL